MIDADDGRFSRRRAFGLLTAAAATLGGCGAYPSTASPSTTSAQRPAAQDTDGDDPRIGPDEAWHMLEAGNARFIDGTPQHPHSDSSWRDSLVGEQHPIASILSCADSRVPPELVFDQGFGDLFTIRSAGEVLDEAVLGSLEYGVEHLDTPLVVVLGHSGCGAVQATIDAVRGDAQPRGHVAALVQAVEPAVLTVPDDLGEDEFLAASVNEQARRVAEALPARSSSIRRAVEQDRIQIVVAVYDLATGRVERKL